MAVTPNTDLTSVLDDLKQTYGKDLEDYRPSFTVLQELLSANRDGVEMGAKINLPVALSHQGGETNDTSGGTATLRNPVSMEIKDASSDQYEITLPVRMPFGLISKAKQGPKARFADKPKLILLSGKKGSLRAAELNLLHGQNSLGKVSAVSAVTGSGPYFIDVTFTAPSWSDGIYGAADNLPFDFYSALTSGTKRNTGDCNVSAVKGWSTDATNPRTVTFTAAAQSDLNTIAANDFVFAASAYGKQMPGLMYQLGLGAAVTHLGISTNYTMWRPKQITVTGPITMGKLLSGISPAISHGAEGKMTVLANARNHADLVKDMVSARRLDASYKSGGKLENGAQSVEYMIGNLTLEIVLHAFMKDGDVAVIPTDNWYRIGSDPEPTMKLDDLQLQVMSANSNTFEFRFWCAQTLMPNLMATSVLFSGITPNAS